MSSALTLHLVTTSLEHTRVGQSRRTWHERERENRCAHRQCSACEVLMRAFRVHARHTLGKLLCCALCL